MPTYAYGCKDCGHAFDTHQAFSDDALTTCPECRGALRKKFNTVGASFKGSGFYSTDSRSGKVSSSTAPSSKKNSSDTPSAAGSSSGSSNTAATNS